jgi:hypothetical protein
MLRYVVYPLFCAMIVGMYAFFAANAIEPFGVSAERSTAPPEAHAGFGSGGHGPGVIWVGGYHGGK